MEYAPFLIFSIILILGLYVYTIMAFFTHVEIETTLQRVDEELTSIGTINKVMISKDCLSTGDIGVLDIASIKSKYKSEDYLKCLEPLEQNSYDYSLEIMSSDDDKWVFGSGIVKKIPTTRMYYIAIKDGDNVIHGNVTLHMGRSDS